MRRRVRRATGHYHRNPPKVVASDIPDWKWQEAATGTRPSTEPEPRDWD